jgi:hypothetical protein
MTLRRAALYIGGASLLVAWFSSAASLSLQRHARTIAIEGDQPASHIEGLAAQVQQQSRRLRERLASAPLPQQPLRNPFTFRTVSPRPQAAPARRLQMAAAAPAEPPEPTLVLIGLAEQKRPQGLVRTAMIATERDELIMATVGDGVLQRYKVTAISEDAVELTDVATGRTRRLALQFE